MSEFGFKVRRVEPGKLPIFAGSAKSYPGGWKVGLPHQCGDWEIAGYHLGAPAEECIRELEKFIAEAQEALTALREGREIGREIGED